jgi:hypothetical protein
VSVMAGVLLIPEMALRHFSSGLGTKYLIYF